MKNYLILFVITVFLFACASNPDYREAKQNGDEGYSESVVEKNRYLVTFTGDSSTTKSEVRDYALLRASELTLEKGYDWFEVLSKDNSTQTEKPTNRSAFAKPQIYERSCGLLGCTTRVYDRTHIDSNIERERTEYQTTFEIVMHKGVAPSNTADSYNAAKLVSTLRNQLETP